jgi:hypothetical protein
MAYQFLSTILGSNANFTGNVGVGTTTPSSKLTVAGNIEQTSTANFVYTNNIAVVSSSANLVLNSSSANVIIPNGNVGIGTATPQGRLNVVSSTTFNTYLINSTSGTGLAFRLYSGYSDILSTYDTIAQNMDITFTPTTISGVQNEAMRIKANGNVLIGTTTDGGQKLQVVGDTKITGATSAGNYSLSVYNSSNAISFYVRGFGDALLAGTLFLGTQNGPNFISNGTLGITSSQGTGNQFVRFTHNNGNNALRILSNSVIELNPVAGNVLVGTTTDNGAKLQVNGTGSFAGDVALNGNRLYIGSIFGNTVLRPISTTNLQLFNANAGAGLFLDANGYVQVGQSNAVNWALFSASGTTIYGTTTLSTLAGTGTRMVVADASGILSTQAVPTGTITGSGTTNYVSKWSSSSSLTNSLLYDNGTNVGVGTTSPASLLHVGAATNFVISGRTSAVYSPSDSSTIFTIGRSGEDYPQLLNFGVSQSGLYSTISASRFTAAENILVLQPNGGNVGIGTTTPIEKLQITDGNVSIRSTAYAGTWGSLRFGTTNNTYANYWAGIESDGQGVGLDVANLKFYTSYGSLSEKMRITPGGNLLIGTTTDNGYKLQINGDSWTNGAARITGTNPLYFESYGGGWYMSDNTYLRTYNDKPIWTGFGYLGSQGGLSVGYGGLDPGYQNAIIAGTVGVGTSLPYGKLSLEADGTVNNYSSVIRVANTGSGKWGGISFVDNQTSTTNANNYYFIGRGASFSDRVLSFHIPTASDYGSGSQPKVGFYSTGADTLFTVEASTGTAYFKGNVLIGTTTNSGYKLDVNGDIQVQTGYIRGANSDADLRLDGTVGSQLRYGGQKVLLNSADAYIYTANTARLYINNVGNINASSLAGSGTRMVVADSTGTLSTQAIPGGGSSYGSWQDNNTQTAATNNTGYGIQFNITNFNSGVDVIPDSLSALTLIKFTNAGKYDIQFSFQFQNTSTDDETVYIWIRKNGENTPDDVPDSNTIISIPKKHGSGTPGKTVAAWNLFVDAAPNDFYQLVWATSNATDVTIQYYGATGFCPATPSTILTVNQVD